MKSAVHNTHGADIVLCDAHTKCLCFSSMMIVQSIHTIMMIVRRVLCKCYDLGLTMAVLLCKINESVVTMLSLMEVTTQKKCWKERALAPAGSRTQDNLCPNARFQQPKPTNHARTIRPFSPYRLVPNDGMVQLLPSEIHWGTRCPMFAGDAIIPGTITRFH